MIDEAERITGRKVVSVRTDNGTEYTNAGVRELLANKDHEKSVPYVKQGNGIAERENRILCDTARSLLHHTELTRTEKRLLWAEAVNTAAYIRNRIPNNRTGSTKTPYELWYGCEPDVSFMRVFGCPAFVHVPDEKRNKFDPKSRKTVLVGYDGLTDKVYRVYDRERRVVERASNVQFEEEDMDDELFETAATDATPVSRVSVFETDDDDKEDWVFEDHENDDDHDDEHHDDGHHDKQNPDEENIRNDGHGAEEDDERFEDAESQVVNPEPVVKAVPVKKGPAGSKASVPKPKPPVVPHSMVRRPDP
jgi:hypothetical protein